MPYDTCVTVTNGTNVMKTCARKLTTTEADFCVKNEASCTFCTSNNCNQVKSDPADSGGTNVLIIVLPIVIAVAVIAILAFVYFRRRR